VIAITSLELLALYIRHISTNFGINIAKGQIHHDHYSRHAIAGPTEGQLSVAEIGQGITSLSPVFRFEQG
jgi:hypothetical protein